MRLVDPHKRMCFLSLAVSCSQLNFAAMNVHASALLINGSLVLTMADGKTPSSWPNYANSTYKSWYAYHHKTFQITYYIRWVMLLRKIAGSPPTPAENFSNLPDLSAYLQTLLYCIARKIKVLLTWSLWHCGVWANFYRCSSQLHLGTYSYNTA